MPHSRTSRPNRAVSSRPHVGYVCASMPAVNSESLLDDTPDWYRDAVIYELHVRAFMDSDGDGIGDFKGLISKLDYLHDLGVTAIWLLPFYPSPLRDDGYDIADYRSVNPAYGSMRDVARLIRAAHERGLRVITELVLNHTSDQHPWFQRARRAPAGSRWRNFYVWSDTPERYKDARIIFKDFESSNWSWDPVAGQYYWHRFYSHQPDLNFENAEVRRALYLAGRPLAEDRRRRAPPGRRARTSTSASARRARTSPRPTGSSATCAPTWTRPSRTACSWPRPTSGPRTRSSTSATGDECHMAFHFPLMPRLFMSIQMEDRFPIIDILQQTPELPEGCQWALFLRNHDELTLEMVTDEERDYMYRVYASEREARINLGIRRRLAPLLGNDRAKIELMNGLLLSLPGTPVIYYGDEIGMGDNVYLGDRDGVRTPMQWTGDRNAGFSARQPAAALPAADHRPRVPLRAGQRREPVAQRRLAAVVDAADAGAAQALRGVRPGRPGVPAPREPAGARLPPHRRGAQRPDRREPLARGPVRRARPVALPRRRAGGAVRPDPLPADRRAAVPAHPRPARDLLAGHRERRRHRGRRRRRVPGHRGDRLDRRPRHGPPPGRAGARDRPLPARAAAGSPARPA